MQFIAPLFITSFILLKLASALSVDKNAEHRVSLYHNASIDSEAKPSAKPSLIIGSGKKSAVKHRKKSVFKKPTFNRKNKVVPKEAVNSSAMESLMASAKQLTTMDSYMNKETMIPDDTNSLLAQFIAGSTSGGLLGRGETEYSQMYPNELAASAETQELKTGEEDQEEQEVPISAKPKKMAISPEISLKNPLSRSSSNRMPMSKPLSSKIPAEKKSFSASSAKEESSSSSHLVNRKKLLHNESLKHLMENLKKDINRLEKTLSSSALNSHAEEPTLMAHMLEPEDIEESFGNESKKAGSTIKGSPKRIKKISKSALKRIKQ